VLLLIDRKSMPGPIRRFAVCVSMLVCTAPGGMLAQTPAPGPEPVVPEKVGKEVHALRISGAAPSGVYSS
jgi:hypothetical protein